MSRYWNVKELLNYRSKSQKRDLEKLQDKFSEWTTFDGTNLEIIERSATEIKRAQHAKIVQDYRNNVLGGLSEEQIIRALKKEYPENFI